MQKYLLLSLKSRNEIYNYSTYLKNNGIFVSIINTPKGVGSSCMLSIKTDSKQLNFIVNLINKKRPKSFLGLYSITQLSNGIQTLRLM